MKYNRKEKLIMNTWNKFNSAILDVIDCMVERNRLIANQNRLKTVIKNEENKMNRAYIELGKYYFSTIKEMPNIEIETAFKQIKRSTVKKAKAKELLNRLRVDIYK